MRYGIGGAKPGSHEMRHAVLVYIRAELGKIERIAVVRIGSSAIAMRPPRMLTELVDGVHNRSSARFLYSERERYRRGAPAYSHVDHVAFAGKGELVKFRIDGAGHQAMRVVLERIEVARL
jgi:hypothetical protein